MEHCTTTVRLNTQTLSHILVSDAWCTAFFCNHPTIIWLGGVALPALQKLMAKDVG